MEMKISNKAERPLLARTVVTGLISFDAATPSRLEIRKKISEAMKVDEGLVTVTNINTSFGSKSAKITAHIYSKKEDLDNYESKTVKNRHLSKEDKAKLKHAKPAAEAAQ